MPRLSRSVGFARRAGRISVQPSLLIASSDQQDKGFGRLRSLSRFGPWRKAAVPRSRSSYSGCVSTWDSINQWGISQNVDLGQHE